MDSNPRQPIYRRPPSDRSVATFKEWLTEMTEALGGTVVDDPAEAACWEEACREFWAAFDTAARQPLAPLRGTKEVNG